MGAQHSRAILVTGGAGYVGSHACKALAAAGYEPIVYDNLSCGRDSAVRWGKLVRGDLHDTDLLAGTLQLHSVAAVMHFPAFANVRECSRAIRNPNCASIKKSAGRKPMQLIPGLAFGYT